LNLGTGIKVNVQDYNKTTLKRRKRIIISIINVCIIFVIVACFVGALVFSFNALNSAKSLKNQAAQVKSEVQVCMDCIKKQDYEGAHTSINNVNELSKSIQAELDQPIWKVLTINSSMKKNITAVNDLLDLLQTASEDVVNPLITQMSEYPMSSLKNENGFNAGTLIAYIDFVDEKDAEFRNLISRIDDLLPRMDGMIALIDKEGKFVKYKDMMTGLSAQYNEIKEYLPVFRTVLGNGENRFYLLVAQNSSEIRALGGFPGSIGTIQIQDGFLKIGDFQSVYNVLPAYTQTIAAKVTETEGVLFDNGMNLPRDAGYNPDFSRVGDVWALSYENKNKKHVDGVISMSPTIIQELLSLGGAITLSDGTELNGDNATRILQYDLYFKYFSKNIDTIKSNEIADALFAESAKKTMDLFTSNFNYKYAKNYFSIFSKGVQNRTIMLWMADEQEEKLMIESGYAGVLNPGKNNAVAGVYFSFNDPQKLGWFLDIKTEVVDEVMNTNGTHTFDVRVVLNNTISSEEIDKGGGYIIGAYNGAMKGFIHLFAPTGGTISNFKSSNNMKMEDANYQGLQLGYCLNVMIYPNKPVEITYKVTTAEDVNIPLTISETPTLQNYR